MKEFVTCSRLKYGVKSGRESLYVQEMKDNSNDTVLNGYCVGSRKYFTSSLEIVLLRHFFFRG